MTLRNQLSAAAGIPQKRSRAFFVKRPRSTGSSRDLVSVGFRTAAAKLSHEEEHGIMVLEERRPGAA